MIDWLIDKGKDARKGVLVLQVIGEKPDERVVLGEVRVNISDVKQREYGRILALQEPKVCCCLYNILIYFHVIHFRNKMLDRYIKVFHI